MLDCFCVSGRHVRLLSQFWQPCWFAFSILAAMLICFCVSGRYVDLILHYEAHVGFIAGASRCKFEHQCRPNRRFCGIQWLRKVHDCAAVASKNFLHFSSHLKALFVARGSTTHKLARFELTAMTSKTSIFRGCGNILGSWVRNPFCFRPPSRKTSAMETRSIGLKSMGCCARLLILPFFNMQEVTDEEIEAAAMEANALNFILDLPEV